MYWYLYPNIIRGTVGGSILITVHSCLVSVRDYTLSFLLFLLCCQRQLRVILTIVYYVVKNNDKLVVIRTINYYSW